MLKKSSRNRLGKCQLEQFPGGGLFNALARAVCNAETLPAKELFEAWETARRIRKQFRGGRIVDMAGGHGLVAHIMLLIDDSSAEAVIIDKNMPANAERLSRHILEAWPRLEHRIMYTKGKIEEFELTADDIVVAVHACGTLTDTVLDRAIEARARIAVLPCCHAIRRSPTRNLENWVEPTLAVDIARVIRLQDNGYTTYLRTIPEEITPKNRLLLAEIK